MYLMRNYSKNTLNPPLPYSKTENEKEDVMEIEEESGDYEVERIIDSQLQ